jgi:hypothetical protein
MNRGAMDVLGMAKKYYKGNRPALLQALSESFGQPVPILERFIDTIYQDPRVRQLWLYLESAYPSKAVEALPDFRAADRGDGAAVAPVPAAPPAPSTVKAPPPPETVAPPPVPAPAPPAGEALRGPGVGPPSDEDDDAGRGSGAPPPMSRST